MRIRTGFSALLLAVAAVAQADSFPVEIRVDAAKSLAPLHPMWRFFGADEPNYATMKDGRKLIAELGALRPGDVYFRAHNLLNTGDGTAAFKWGSTNAYTEDAQGRPIYDWRIVDRIFDTYLARGVRPYAQIGFMPQALSTQPEPYQHAWRPGFEYGLITGGWAYPPRDYARWAELVHQWVRHCVDRYGRAEVEKWYWEVWNEADGPAYWHGTPEEFYKLHDYAIDAVRRALPTARVGGPDSANGGNDFTKGFLDHIANGRNFVTGEKGTPTDFLAFHAKGAPEFVDGHVRMGIGTHLSRIDRAMAIDRHLPAAEEQADRDRRIRSGRLRRLPGAAARLSQRHHVFELHGGEFRAQADARGQARRDSRWRPDLGVRVRGSAVFRGLPRTGQQRHRSAGAERVPHVREDEWPPRAGIQQRRSIAGADARQWCAGPGPTSRQ